MIQLCDQAAHTLPKCKQMKPQKKDKPLDPQVIQKLMAYALTIDTQNEEHCRDFSIFQSDEFPDSLILRWTCIDISDIDRPLQIYRYECFTLDGMPLHCSIHYSDQAQANHFFEGLKLRYTQEFANDHKTQ